MINSNSYQHFVKKLEQMYGHYNGIIIWFWVGFMVNSLVCRHVFLWPGVTGGNKMVGIIYEVWQVGPRVNKNNTTKST